ncbi:MAG TPA: hypothetical protein VIJ77_04855 [Candidatus Tumulicola sp.]
MKRSTVFVSLAAAALVAAASAKIPAAAETIVYEYPALPGPASTCQWFDDNLNDRSIDALIRQTDLLYNRAALPPGKPVTVTATAMTADGGQIAQFSLKGRLLCTGAQALHPEMPEPSPSPIE